MHSVPYTPIRYLLHGHVDGKCRPKNAESRHIMTVGPKEVPPQNLETLAPNGGSAAPKRGKCRPKSMGLPYDMVSKF